MRFSSQTNRTLLASLAASALVSAFLFACGSDETDPADSTSSAGTGAGTNANVGGKAATGGSTTLGRGGAVTGQGGTATGQGGTATGQGGAVIGVGGRGPGQGGSGGATSSCVGNVQTGDECDSTVDTAPCQRANRTCTCSATTDEWTCVSNNGGATGAGGRSPGGATSTGGRSPGGATSTGGRSPGGATSTGGRSPGGATSTGGRAQGGSGGASSTCVSGVATGDTCIPSVDTAACVRSDRTCTCSATSREWTCVSNNGGASGVGGRAGVGGRTGVGGRSTGGAAGNNGTAGAATITQCGNPQTNGDCSQYGVGTVCDRSNTMNNPRICTCVSGTDAQGDPTEEWDCVSTNGAAGAGG